MFYNYQGNIPNCGKFTR